MRRKLMSGRGSVLRRALGACLAGAVVLMATSAARASLTTVYANPGGEPSLYVGTGSLYTGSASTIMSTLGYGSYGTGFVRVDDSSDELYNYVVNSASITASAKFAGANSTFGVFASPGNNTFTALSSVSGGGYDSAHGGTTTFPGGTITINRSTVQDPFSWGIQNASNTFNSIASKNTDPGGPLDHMVTFKILTGASAGRYVLAFEDVAGPQSNTSDRDFNDLVVEVSGVSPVPEPGTMALAAAGLLVGVPVALRRRKAAKSAA